MNINEWDVIEVAAEQSDYPAEDQGKLAVQWRGEFIAFVGDLAEARALIRKETGTDVRLVETINYWPARRWIPATD
jgi:hypothetical protein